jgi:hypothetical protein
MNAPILDGVENNGVFVFGRNLDETSAMVSECMHDMENEESTQKMMTCLHEDERRNIEVNFLNLSYPQLVRTCCNISRELSDPRSKQKQNARDIQKLARLMSPMAVTRTVHVVMHVPTTSAHFAVSLFAANNLRLWNYQNAIPTSFHVGTTNHIRLKKRLLTDKWYEYTTMPPGQSALVHLFVDNDDEAKQEIDHLSNYLIEVKRAYSRGKYTWVMSSAYKKDQIPDTGKIRLTFRLVRLN